MDLVRTFQGVFFMVNLEIASYKMRVPVNDPMILTPEISDR